MVYASIMLTGKTRKYRMKLLADVAGASFYSEEVR